MTEQVNEQVKNRLVDEVQKAAPFFKVSLRIEIFGRTIFEWTWPPQK